jgi:hypothetical protein
MPRTLRALRCAAHSAHMSTPPHPPDQCTHFVHWRIARQRVAYAKPIPPTLTLQLAMAELS